MIKDHIYLTNVHYVSSLLIILAHFGSPLQIINRAEFPDVENVLYDRMLIERATRMHHT